MSKHPKSLANLKPPWPKGVSGNPNGRPPRPDVDLLNETIASSGLNKAVVANWIEHALGNPKKGIKPDFKYFQLLIAHRNGNVPQEISIAGSQTSDAIREQLQQHEEEIKTKRHARRASKKLSSEGGATSGVPGAP